MAKPTIYLDTNIFSTLYFRGHDVAALSRQLTTWDWWDNERQHFSLYSSIRTEMELSEGQYQGQENAIAALKRIRYLPFTNAVKDCVFRLFESGIIPIGKPGDAHQLAFATVHRVDYLLTWNCAHLANVQVQKQLDVACRRFDWRAPWIVSPAAIPKVSLGQIVRRNDG